MKVIVRFNNEEIPVSIPPNPVQVFDDRIEGSAKIMLDGIERSVWGFAPCDENGVIDSSAEILVQVYEIETGKLILEQQSPLLEE